MILTGTGQRFRRDREAGGWRCVEHPDLLMLPGGRYLVSGREFDSLAEALLHSGLVPPRCPSSAGLAANASK